MPTVKMQKSPAAAERLASRMAADCSSPTVGRPSVRKINSDTLSEGSPPLLDRKSRSSVEPVCRAPSMSVPERQITA